MKPRPIEREDGWSRESHRDAGGDFEQIAPELRRVVGGAARGQHNEARKIAPQDGAQFLDRSAIGLECPFEHGRLLVDIVSHFRHKDCLLYTSQAMNRRGILRYSWRDRLRRLLHPEPRA